MKAKEAFFVSSTPHWRAPISSRNMVWQFLAALSLVWLFGVMKDGPAAFWLVIFSVFLGILFRFLTSLALKRKKRLEGSTILSCMLFASLVPYGLPFLTLAAGIFFATVVAEECFGGRGQNIFNPALIGFMAVNLLFSDQLSFCYENFGSILLLTDVNRWMLTIEIILIVIAGLFLILRRVIAWQLPFFYLIPAVFSIMFFQNIAAAKLPVAPVLFTAFFLVTDYASSPITAKGRAVFAFGCGLLFVALNEWVAGFDAIGCSILLMNSISPLIDRYIKTERQD